VTSCWLAVHVAIGIIVATISRHTASETYGQGVGAEYKAWAKSNAVRDCTALLLLAAWWEGLAEDVRQTVGQTESAKGIGNGWLAMCGWRQQKGLACCLLLKACGGGGKWWWWWWWWWW